MQLSIHLNSVLSWRPFAISMAIDNWAEKQVSLSMSVHQHSGQGNLLNAYLDDEDETPGTAEHSVLFLPAWQHQYQIGKLVKISC